MKEGPPTATVGRSIAPTGPMPALCRPRPIGIRSYPMARTPASQDRKPSAPKRPRLVEARRGLLTELVGYHLRRAQVRLFEDFARTVGGHDVTPGQFGVLVLIEANAGLNQSELGAAMGVDRSTVVAVIDRLEARRLVARKPAPADRRSYALELTAQGRALLDRLIPLVREHDRRIARDLSPAEQATLIRLLARIGAD